MSGATWSSERVRPPSPQQQLLRIPVSGVGTCWCYKTAELRGC
jgi:hypothetical protein